MNKNHAVEDPVDVKAQQLRDLIREANQAQRDLRNEMRTAQQQWTEFKDRMHEEINAEIRKHVNGLGEATKSAMNEACERVYREFDKLAGILLGLTEDDAPTLEELVATMNAARARRGKDPIVGLSAEARAELEESRDPRDDWSPGSYDGGLR